MADYPSFMQLEGSEGVNVDDLVVERAVSGKARGQSFYNSVLKDFKIKHMLNATDRDTLVAFYASNKTTSFTFTWAEDSVVYTCIFSKPISVLPIGAGIHDVTVLLSEVG